MAPRLGLEPPLEIAGPRVRLPVFGVPGGPPPKNPFLSKHTYLLWFLMIFRRNGARKRDSREHHRFGDAPPGGAKEPPEKCARAPRTQTAPPGPRQGPPGPCAQPPGGPRGGTGGSRGAQGGHGGIPQLLLHVPTNIDGFLEMLLWPLFRACFFLKT